MIIPQILNLSRKKVRCMNMSRLVTRIKLKLGLNVITAPFDVNQLIQDVIKIETLPVFSLYAPLRETFHVKLNEMKQLEKGPDYVQVLLPEFRSNPIIAVEDVSYDDNTLSDYTSCGYCCPYRFDTLWKTLVSANAGMNLVRGMLPSVTFKYDHPRKLTVYNAYITRRLSISLAMEHDETLASIKPTTEESLYELALLDVKVNLYSNMKHYTELQSAYGTINLKIDDWSNAEGERKELLNTWGDSYHLDGPQMIYK